MNIPNIEVTSRSSRVIPRESTTDYLHHDAGERDGRDREELHDHREYKELQCDTESELSRELSVQRATDVPILSRNVDRQRDHDQTVEGPHADRPATCQKEQIVPGTVSQTAEHNSGASERGLFSHLVFII